MAVPEQTPYNIYTANGITTVFPYEFYILQAGDLAVSIDGATVTTGFTVSGVGTVNGGEVTFLIAPASGSTVMLERIIPAMRTTDYQDNGDLLADTVNTDFDRVWMAIRQAFVSLGVALSRPLLGGPFNAKEYRIANLSDPVNDQDAATKKWAQEQGTANLNKTLRIPGNYIAPLPPLDDGEGKTIVVQGGVPRWITPESGTATDVLVQLGSSDEGKGDYLLAVKQPYAGAVPRTQHDKNAELISVQDFGAKGDGIANDSVAVQAAIDAANGKDIYFPSGTYRVNVELPKTLSNYKIVGDRGKTVIKPYNPLIPSILDKSNRTWSYAKVEGISFYGYTLGSQIGCGFSFGPTDWDGTGENYANRGRVVFSHCDFLYLDRGIYKKYGNIGNKYESCRFAYNNYGVFGQGNKVNGESYPTMHSGNDTYDVCEFDGNKIAGTAYLDTTAGAGQWTYRQCIFQYNEGFGAFFDFNISGNLLYRPIVFDNCWFEDNATATTVDVQTLSGVLTLAPLSYRAAGVLYPIINISSTTNFATQIGIGVSHSSGTVGRLHVVGDTFLQGLGNRITMGLAPGGDAAYIENSTDADLVLHPRNQFRSVRITENATFIVGEAAGSGAGTHRIKSRLGNGAGVLTISSANRDCIQLIGGDSVEWSTAGANMHVGSLSGRSINAAGTVNTGGSDYAEYVLKNDTCGEIPKGAICGIDANGLLTDKYDEAISFVIKTTNPSFVGGDTWFSEVAPEQKTKEWFVWMDAINAKSIEIDSLIEKDKENGLEEVTAATCNAKKTHLELLNCEPTGNSPEYEDWISRREAARVKMDRIAFCGQVPCNVTGATVGDYIIPTSIGDGLISGEPVSAPTFEQYMAAVGRVWKIMDDGRAWVAVKVS